MGKRQAWGLVHSHGEIRFGVLHFEGFSKLLVGTCVPLIWIGGVGLDSNPSKANEETTQPPNRGAPSRGPPKNPAGSPWHREVYNDNVFDLLARHPERVLGPGKRGVACLVDGRRGVPLKPCLCLKVFWIMNAARAGTWRLAPSQ